MIAEQYIKEGVRLREFYIENLQKILDQEPIINERKKVFDEIKQEMEKTVFSELNAFTSSNFLSSSAAA